VDSFAGFPELSSEDPADSAAMFRDNSYEEIVRIFSPFPHVKLCRGFIPDILRTLPDQQYATVYYDCDLYEPAIESLRYFLPRLLPGGFFLIHDYLPKCGGFDGVKLAVDAFLDGTSGIDRFEVPETTHLILRKH
jgi:O-methyltransferase